MANISSDIRCNLDMVLGNRKNITEQYIWQPRNLASCKRVNAYTGGSLARRQRVPFLRGLPFTEREKNKLRVLNPSMVTMAVINGQIILVRTFRQKYNSEKYLNEKCLSTCNRKYSSNHIILTHWHSDRPKQAWLFCWYFPHKSVFIKNI